EGSGAVGMAHGAYVVYGYCVATTEQATIAAKTVPREASALTVSIDVEPPVTPADTPSAKVATAEQTRGRVLDLAAKLRDIYGKVPLVYGNRRFQEALQGAGAKEYMLWLASYTRSAEPTASDLRLSGSNPWTIWRYTAHATVPAIGNNVDMNAF